MSATEPLSTPPVPLLQRRRLRFVPGRGLVARGREFTRQVLEELHPGPGGDAEFLDDILLTVSELVSNAVQHAGGPTEIAVTLTPRRVRIDVLDGSSHRPLRRPTGPAFPGGHGLRILDRLTSRWGTSAFGSGKSVWVEFDLPDLPDLRALPGFP